MKRCGGNNMGGHTGPLYFTDDFFDYDLRELASAGLVEEISGTLESGVSGVEDRQTLWNIRTNEGLRAITHGALVTSVGTFAQERLGIGIRSYVLTQKGAPVVDRKPYTTLRIICAEDNSRTPAFYIKDVAELDSIRDKLFGAYRNNTQNH
jgi:hypothetical protein